MRERSSRRTKPLTFVVVQHIHVLRGVHHRCGARHLHVLVLDLLLHPRRLEQHRRTDDAPDEQMVVRDALDDGGDSRARERGAHREPRDRLAVLDELDGMHRALRRFEGGLIASVALDGGVTVLFAGSKPLVKPVRLKVRREG